MFWVNSIRQDKQAADFIRRLFGLKRKTVYYTDEHSDEFSRVKITPKKIYGSYDYFLSSPKKTFLRFFFQRIIAAPCAFLYMKLMFARRTVGKERLKPYRRVGFFLYGNHTHEIGDACNPKTLVFPKDAYTLVHAANVSMPLLGKITPYLGAIPLPDGIAAYRSFTDVISRRIGEGACVVIYPEAHIWPYHTGIRSFPDTSFYYPARLAAPVFCFTNTYHKRSPFGVKIITYVDGPFFPDESLNIRERARDLRSRVFTAMKKRARSSTLTLIEYVKKENESLD